MRPFLKLSLFAMMLLTSIPSQAADELITGVKNEYVLMGFLGIGIFLLFVCILTMAYFLYTMIPTLLKKKYEQEQKEAVSAS